MATQRTQIWQVYYHYKDMNLEAMNYMVVDKHYFNRNFKGRFLYT